jgi:hypothetical protein
MKFLIVDIVTKEKLAVKGFGDPKQIDHIRYKGITLTIIKLRGFYFEVFEKQLKLKQL